MNVIVWEWVASLIAGIGSAWFAHEITHAFQRIYLVLPPTGGPTELIGFAVLIWLWAKYQRHLASLPAPALTAKN